MLTRSDSILQVPMRVIDKEQWQRIQLLLETLQEIAAARAELFHQLEELNAREIAVRSEHNSLHNNVATVTANLPNEVLSMVFKAGVYHTRDSIQFSVPISHVSQRWRSIALSAPELWTNIWCAQPDPPVNRSGWLSAGLKCRESFRYQTAAFLSRSSNLSLTISFLRCSYVVFSQDFLTLVGESMKRCRQLRFKDSNFDGLDILLKYLANKHAPRLSSIDFDVDDDRLTFRHTPFQLGAPLLKVAQLNCVQLSTIHHCTVAFVSLTTMRLTGIYISDNDAYNHFREHLMAMKSLTHLELHFEEFADLPHTLPIELLAVQFLMIDIIFNPDDIGNLIQVIRAPSLCTLSLAAWHQPELRFATTHPNFGDIVNIRVSFSSLKHLILNDISKATPDLSYIALIFPDIERLTCQVIGSPKLPTTESCGVADVLEAIACLVEVYKDGDKEQALVQWPRLQSIAMSINESFDVVALEDRLRIFQDHRHPLHELMLPKELLSDMDTEAIASLKHFINLKGFIVDWPTPFACHACGSHTHLQPPTCRENCSYFDIGGT